MSMSDSAIDLQGALRDHFGLERFRPGQREVIEAVLARRDVLCVMPTGGGKSLCYQLPSIVASGVTLVVSPLIALMKDQVDALSARGLNATFINSTLDAEEQRLRIFAAEAGQFDLLYVAPERFRSRRFLETMQRIRPTLLAVDEAHCISEWGHDFRPDYARLGQARRALGMPPCIALTATATDLVRRDIATQLDLREPEVFVTGFDRPNLSYRVVDTPREQDKLNALAECLERFPGPAVVYASSRKRCEEVAGHLQGGSRRRAVVYHAGLERDRRTEAQDQFMTGGADVIVATNAFGMGVDKADIRSVIHYNMPGTIEAYYQEAGRAGRDGLPAQCVLLYAQGDRFLQELFIENEYPPPEAVFRIYDYLRSLDDDPIERTQTEIREALGIDLAESAVGAAIRILESAGALEVFRPRENMAIVRIHPDPDDATPLASRLSPQATVQRVVLAGLEGLVGAQLGEPVYFHPEGFANALGLDRAAFLRALKHLATELPIDYIPPFRGNAVRVLDRERRARDLRIDFTALNERKRQEFQKLDHMIRYAHDGGCRRATILGYFGDLALAGTRCGRCDSCNEGAEGKNEVQHLIESPEGCEILLKVLSGVARTKGRFGKTAIAQMLVGSGAERMERSGLKRLSTYGILSDSGFTQRDVSDLLDALTARGLCESEEVDRFRPVLHLSDAGWQWLKTRGEEGLALAVSADLARRLGATVDRGGNSGVEARRRTTEASDERGTPPEEAHPRSESDDDDLRQVLSELRSTWATEGNQPRYCVFGNQVLEALVRERPSTMQELQAIKGIGPSKLERYGPALLEAIAAAGTSGARRADSPEPAPEPAPEIATNEPETLASIPTEEWTWRLLDRGFRLDEAAAIRGLDRSAILRHALLVAGAGRPIATSAYLADEVAHRWSAWYREQGETPPPAELGGPLDTWALFVAAQRAAAEPRSNGSLRSADEPTGATATAD